MSTANRASSERLAEERGAGPVGKLWGRIRRFTVDATTAAVWRLVGHASLRERPEAEVFQHVGFSSRPPAGQGEVMVLMLGKNAPIVIASRDRATLKAVIDDILGADEAALHNSSALVHVKADGTIEAKSAGGSAGALALAAALDDLADRIASDLTGATAADLRASIQAVFLAWVKSRTVVLKAE